MKKNFFQKIEFVTSAIDEKGYPVRKNDRGKLFPEIALVGRSNVGKSSLINNLLNRKKIAKVSATPGKTQLINFFSIDDELFLVDLPGYGYAKVPISVKKTWSEAIENYFLAKQTIRLVLFLLDIRRLPNEQDLSFFKWTSFHKLPIIIVFTKTDKLSNTMVAQQTKKIFESLPLESIPLFVNYSIHDPHAKLNLIKMISDHKETWQ